MRMKKIFLLFVMLFMLTGCTANYELSYYNDSLEEKLIIPSSNVETSNGYTLNALLEDYFNNMNLLVNYKIQSGDGDDNNYPHYNKSFSTISGLNLNYSYSEKEDFNNSSIVYSLFEKVNITDNYIKAREIKNIFNNYELLDEINIVFKTDKNVTSNNADKIVNDEYIWVINKNNYQNKIINITYDNKKKINVFGEKENSILNYILIILGSVLALGVLIVFFKISISNKK